MMLTIEPIAAERVYYVQSGVQALAHAIMFTVYVVYFVQMADLNPLQLVLVGTALELTAFVFEVPTGVVADTYSRRLSIILGMVCLGASFVLTGALPWFVPILLAQVISGMGYTFLSGATDAWLADEVGEANVGAIYLRAGQINRVAGLVGTGLSVALAGLRLNLPYLVGGGLYLGLGMFLALYMGEHGFRPQRRQASLSSAWASMWTTFAGGARLVRATPILLALVGVEVFSGAASEGFDRLGDAHLLQNFTFPPLGALQPVVWFGILGVVGRVLSLIAVEPLRKRLGKASRDPRAMVRALLILEALGLVSTLGFALAGSFWLAVATLMLRGVVGSLSSPLFITWLVQNTRPEVRATVLSMVSQSNAFGQIVGGPGVGLIGNASLVAALTASGLLLTPILLLYAWALRHGRLDEPRVEAAPLRSDV